MMQAPEAWRGVCGVAAAHRLCEATKLLLAAL